MAEFAPAIIVSGYLQVYDLLGSLLDKGGTKKEEGNARQRDGVTILAAMKIRFQKLMRWTASAIALTLVGMASAPAALWRCLDGTPCVTNCGMGPGHTRLSPETALEFRCGDCPSATISPTASRTELGGARCVLTVDERPFISLSEQLVPPAAHTVLPSARDVLVEFTPNPIFFAEQPPLLSNDSTRPYSGRGPPFVS